MKKLLTLLGIFSLAVFFFGCDEEPTEPDTIVPPTNLTLAVAGSDSLSLELSWDASADTVDGYLVYFEGDVIDTVTAITYTDKPTALGKYKVTAYKGSKVSDPTSTVSSELVEDINQGPVYWTGDVDPAHPSGYGWASDGTGKAYCLTTGKGWTNTDNVDFILDYYGKKSTLTIRDPHNFDPAFDHTTGVAYLATWTYDNLAEAQLGGYVNFEDVVSGGTYTLWVHGKYYVKMTVTATDKDITFKYGFQTIPGFRRLK